MHIKVTDMMEGVAILEDKDLEQVNGGMGGGYDGAKEDTKKVSCRNCGEVFEVATYKKSAICPECGYRISC